MTLNRKKDILEKINAIVDRNVLKGNVDIVKLAISNGFYVCKLKEGADIKGVILVDERSSECLPNNKVIAFKSELSEKENRFIIAHELGHYFLHYKKDDNLPFVYTYHYERTDTVAEEEADFFATNLLVPEQEYKNKCNELGKLRATEFGIQYLSDYFNVSDRCIRKRYIEIYGE